MTTTTDTKRKTADLIDRATELLPASIRATWSDTCDPGDPWGDAMSHAFALNDIAQLLGLATDPTYRPAMGLSWACVAEEYPSAMYADDYHAGHITADDIAAAIPVLSTLLHGLELLGLSY